jgi:integrase
MAAAKPLTDISIRNLKPGAARYEVPDPGARGLSVVVFPSGKRSFIVRYRIGGKQKKLTLAGGIKLTDARKDAADAMFEVSRGRDPSEAKKATKQKAAAAAADTVKAVCEEYLKREGKRLRTVKQRQRSLERLVYPALGHRQIDMVKRSEVIRLLDKIEDENGARMADDVLAVLRRIMNWHAARSDEFRSPIVRGMARTKSEERARSRILNDDELRKVWKAATAAEGPFPALVRFLLLTTARRKEAAAMARQELDGADWTLPASRNKTKLDLVRPLSQAAQAVLAKQPCIDGCAFVFTTNGTNPISGFSKFKRKFDKTCGVSDWTLHDLRRTARSLMSRAGVNSDHAERCLGHKIGGVRETYDRHKFYAEKKVAFEMLAAQIERIVDPQPNVVSLRR